MDKIKTLNEVEECVCWENAEGTSTQLDSRCGSWKQHYINVTQKPFPAQCSCLDCYSPAHDVCHVINKALSGNKLYIVPLCSRCNHRQGTFALYPGTVLVEISGLVTDHSTKK